jgi:hypothetical protein
MGDQTMVTQNAETSAAGTNGRRFGPDGEENRSRNDLRSGGNMVMQGVAGFGESLITLAELQGRLAQIELQQNIQAARTAIVLALASGGAMFSGVIILLAGIAELLVSELGVRRGFALVSVAAITIAIGAGALAVAATRIRTKRAGFPLSYEELTRNLNWLRTVLRQTGRR